MNAHTSIDTSSACDLPIKREDGQWHGVARHVSADGCQLIITGQMPGKGQRLGFAIGSGITITGSIRWVVNSCAGFVFDRVIDRTTAGELSAYLAKFRTLELVALAPSPSPA